MRKCEVPAQSRSDLSLADKSTRPTDAGAGHNVTAFNLTRFRTFWYVRSTLWQFSSFGLQALDKMQKDNEEEQETGNEIPGRAEA